MFLCGEGEGAEVDGLDGAGPGADVVMFSDVGSGGATETRGESGVADDLEDGACEDALVAGGEEDAGLSVGDDFATAGDVGGDDDLAEGHALEEGEGGTSVAGGEDVDGGDSGDLVGVVAVAGAEDLGGDAELSSEVAAEADHRSVADEEEAEAGLDLEDVPRGAKKGAGVLGGVEASGHEDETGAGSEVEATSDLCAARARKRLVDFDAVGNGVNARGEDEPETKGGPGLGLGGADHGVGEAGEGTFDAGVEPRPSRRGVVEEGKGVGGVDDGMGGGASRGGPAENGDLVSVKMRDVEPPAPEDRHDAIGGLDVPTGMEEGADVEGEDADVKSAEVVEELGTVESGGDDDGVEERGVEVAKEELEKAGGPAPPLADDVKDADPARETRMRRGGLRARQSGPPEKREEIEDPVGHGLHSGARPRMV